MNSLLVGGNSFIDIDWVVAPVAPGLYLYAYQIENRSGVGLDAFSITFNPGTSVSNIVAFGFEASDIDDSGHNSISFPSLATETEGLIFTPVTNGLATINPLDNTISWSFDPLQSGRESNTLAFLYPQAPTYGNAVAQDSIPPSPWATLGNGSQPVPVPVPEPGSFAALASGMGALLVGLRRRSK